MNPTSFFTLRGAALALALGLVPAAGAWAAPQSITIPSGTTVAHAVCGNGNTADNGNAPCDPAFDGNTVTIATGGQVLAYVFGRFDEQTGVDTTATGNKVDISGSVSAFNSYGALARSITSGNATATGNSLTVRSGATTWTVLGAIALSDAGLATATATGNSVSVLGGNINGAINGAITGGDAENYGTGNAVSTGNTVTISGGTVDGGIYAGYASSGGGTETATNNTLNISGVPVFGANAELYGGFLQGGGAGTSTGNTLNLHTAGLSVTDLGFFQNLNFYLPAGLASSGNMLSVTNTAALGTNTVVNVALEGAGPALTTGATFNLIAANAMTGSVTPTSGVIGGYNYTLAITGNNLVLTIGSKAAGSAAAVPTLGEYALALLGLLLAGFAFVTLRRKV